MTTVSFSTINFFEFFKIVGGNFTRPDFFIRYWRPEL
jgi:hypothetical protein